MTNKKDAKKRRRDMKPEFIIRPVPQLSRKIISEAQHMQLEVIAKTNFNFVNGERIAKWLREDRRIWRTALLLLNYRSLRDMDDGHRHADTLYIYLEEAMKGQFGADETAWIGCETAVDMLGTTEVKDKSYVILDAWWD
jgi:hypothetical protein